ncbi:Na(+)-translocating NADH-quinone reductase subunit C [Desulfatiferula olefinivorans]
MSDSLKSVVFAALLSLVSCLLITAACTGLQKFQKINAEVDRQVNIIRSVGLVEPGKDYAKEDIARLYTAHIVDAWALPSGDLSLDPPADGAGAHPLYLYKKNDALAAYILPLDSRGLWGRIYGYLALEGDGKTIEGFTVFNHAETPGLGGEIESDWFTANFKGKTIADERGQFVSVTIAKGTAADRVPEKDLDHYVDGISGATLTGNYLNEGFRETLTRFEPLSERFRSGNAPDVRFKEP